MEIHSNSKHPLFLLLLCFLILLSSATGTSEFIRSKCSTTEFPHLCFSTLNSLAPLINGSAVRLARAALNISLVGARAASAQLAANRALVKGSSALGDCVQMLADSVDSLRSSLKEMSRLLGVTGTLERRNIVGDVQTWVSAALTDDGTCMDGFAGEAAGGDKAVRTVLRQRIAVLAHLTSIALALINALN